MLPLPPLLLLLLAGPARPISFQLPGKARKCLREEIHRDTLVTGEYEIGAPPGSSAGPAANLKVPPRAGGEGPGGRARRRAWTAAYTWHRGRGPTWRRRRLGQLRCRSSAPRRPRPCSCCVTVGRPPSSALGGSPGRPRVLGGCTRPSGAREPRWEGGALMGWQSSACYLGVLWCPG